MLGSCTENFSHGQCSKYRIGIYRNVSILNTKILRQRDEYWMGGEVKDGKVYRAVKFLFSIVKHRQSTAVKIPVIYPQNKKVWERVEEFFLPYMGNFSHILVW